MAHIRPQHGPFLQDMAFTAERETSDQAASRLTLAAHCAVGKTIL